MPNEQALGQIRGNTNHKGGWEEYLKKKKKKTKTSTKKKQKTQKKKTEDERKGATHTTMTPVLRRAATPYTDKDINGQQQLVG